MNEEFGVPQVAPSAEESTADRVARLRAKAAAQVEQEFDEDAVLAQFLSEARAKKLADLSKDPINFATDTKGFPDDFDVITIFAGRDKNDLSYVPLGFSSPDIGQITLKVPRGVEVILPHIFVANCLDLAIETITTPKLDARGNLAGLEIRDAHRFPYNFKRKATKEEYKAFQESQKEKATRETRQAA